MIGNILFAFFIGMPAVVIFANRNAMRHPLSRILMTWGGAVAVILAAVLIIPLLACDGSMISGYTECVGGAGLSAVVTQSHPMIILAGKFYILIGVPLALIIFALDRSRAA